jgi:hypothetical protein
MHEFIQEIGKTPEGKYVWNVYIVNGKQKCALFTSVCEFDTAEEAKHDLFIVNTFLNIQQNEWKEVPPKTEESKQETK